ncbi:MAG: chromosome segregation protein SMC [Limosilactobacillus sp.]|uniref:chromosome segregation protein SMC n=1 Tax=Limosilactobacillus sp. TaxID=2773925 RepID=UPI0026FAEE7E|nr:chromosome segregation protein SMC [Limosilactobacillus sp.]
MRLLSLTIDGFKSFARKTTINFEQGMTGIVGPNGSGKSNVIESIRWVLGEQSARSLRGDKMADVIFGGSTSHAPLNRAMVSITLDNSDHYIASEFTEITITRKLFRNGDSEYLINGKKVRLKDIVDLFIDSGLGRESFSIISQGRIEEIFNGKPEDRRAIIETVAGVAKYRKNKETAEKRLSSTMDNLNRVNDIISVLSGQLEPLADQSALAKDYLEQKEQFDRFDQTRIVRDYDSKHDLLKQVRGELSSAQDMSNKYMQELASAEKQLTQLKQERAKLLKDKDATQQTILEQTQLIADIKNERSLSSVKQQQQAQEKSRLDSQLAANKEELADLQGQLDKLLATIKDHTADVVKHQEEQEAAKKLTAGERIKKLQARLADLRNQQIDLLQKQTTLHNEATFLQQSHQQSLSQQKQSNSELQASEQRKAELEEQVKAKQAEIEQQTITLEDSRKEMGTVQKKLSDLNDRYQKTQRQWYQVLGDAHSTQSRIKALQSMEEEYAGYYRGVQSVLKSRNNFAGLAGAVSELIDVPSDLTTAIETVLGGQLQQLVVDTQATGKAIIQFLIRQRAGRVTILPLDTLRKRQPLNIWATIEGMPGYVGRAVDLVKFDKKYQTIVDHLLSNTVVADNLDNATAIARSGRHQVRVVTLDGQLINASGAMTGGANKHQQNGLLSQKNSGKQFEELLAKQEQQAKELEEAVAKLQQSSERGQAKLSELQETVHAQESVLQESKAQAQRLADQVSDVERQIAALRFQNGEQNNQHQSYQDSVAKNKAAQDETDQKLADIKAETAQANDQISQLQTNADNQNEQLNQLNQWLAVARERGQQYRQQEIALRGQIQGKQDTIKKLEQDLDELSKNISAQTNDGQSTKEALESAQQLLDLQQGVLSEHNDKLETLEEKIGDAEASQDRIQGLQHAASDNLNQLNERRVRSEAQIDQLLNRLNEHYSMDIDEARDKADAEISDQDLATRLKLLKRGLDELGDVNISAIDEYNRVKERYDFLKGQQTDLLESRDQLKQTMDEMDGEVKQRFLDTFKKVSVAFDETFRQIFAGGRAKLELTDPDDLLTSGVDIIAQPPGKKNQHMNLLSGGERALTAITLLFAILKVRPVPFAILDEPEAALDEVNVQRFANYLTKFGKTGPQFIVITHRKGTMMGADVLYGVTMQESGISKMVSVDVVDTLNENEE